MQSTKAIYRSELHDYLLFVAYPHINMSIGGPGEGDCFQVVGNSNRRNQIIIWPKIYSGHASLITSKFGLIRMVDHRDLLNDSRPKF